jgi:protocatechuate 3,4-dioxygenase beta subunit
MVSRLLVAIALLVADCSAKPAAHPHISVRAGHYDGRLWTAFTNDGDVKISRIKWIVKFVEGPSGRQKGQIHYDLMPGQTVNVVTKLQVPPKGQHWRADHIALKIYADGRWIEP